MHRKTSISNVPADWGHAIEGWSGWLLAGAVRAATLELRLYQLRRFARDHRHLGPFDVDAAAAASWVGGHGWQAETIRSHRAALRSFYGWAHSSGLSGHDPSRLLRKVPAAPIRPRPAPEAAIAAALAAADPRLALMIALGSRHGLRRGEIAQAHTRDLVEDLDGWSLTVHGKGGKDRDVPLLPATAATLRAAPAGWLFPNRRGGHLTPAHTGRLLRLALSGTDGRVTGHQLRHRYATVIYRETGDLLSVQELLGHASPATTIRYVKGDQGRRRRVAAAAA